MSAQRWRDLVAKYFKPEDVEKALYVIDHESGGRADAVGDNGASHGLFQLNDNGLGSGMSVADRLDPEKNIATAAKAVYGGSGWKPWGEGALYQGHAFGSLGNNPYGGGSAVNGRAEDAPSGGSTVADTSGDYDNGTTAYIIGILGQPPKRDDEKYKVDASGNPVSTSMADANWGEAIKIWGDAALALGRSYQLTHPTKSIPNPNQLTREDILAQNGISNADSIAATRATSQHYANVDAQTKAQSDINAFFSGQEQSRQRADLALKGQEDLIKWGTAPGKSSYSANDLGAAFANTMRQAGMDPSKGMLNYTGTTYLDPIGDLQRGDNLLGATGKPPGSANLLTGETDPASSGYSPGATPPPPSLDGAIAGLRGPSGVGSSVKGGLGSVGGALQGAGAPLAVSGAPGNDDWRNNLLHGAGLTWDKAPALFKWG